MMEGNPDFLAPHLLDELFPAEFIKAFLEKTDAFTKAQNAKTSREFRAEVTSTLADLIKRFPGVRHSPSAAPTRNPAHTTG